MALHSRPALAAAAIVLAGAASNATAQPAELPPCRVAGIRHEVLCGQVRRALDPSRPDGPQIDVHYVVVPAMARRKLADPVFLLAGGPGQSAIGVAPTLMSLFSRLNNRRDIVFVDQRGTGRSAPLNCPDDHDPPLAGQSDPAAQLRRLARCKAELLKRPYVREESDLGFFTTTLAMQDLDAVRQRLGAAQINLVGASYGTRAALEYMRQFPQAVRRSVLDGVAPPDMALPASVSADAQAVFDALLAACAAEARCAAAYPRLRDDWTALLGTLPKDVTVTDPRSGRPERFMLTRDAVLGAVRGALYAPAFGAGLPAAITAAAHGRFEPLAGLAAWQQPPRPARLATGQHVSVICAEDMPRAAAARDAPGQDFGASFAQAYGQACAQWPRGDVPEAFYTVPAFARPVLLASGGLDPVTPPRHGARVAAALGPSARHVVVPQAGHGVLTVGCMRDVLFRFIDAASDAQAQAVDGNCASAIPRPPAFVPPAVAEDTR